MPHRAEKLAPAAAMAMYTLLLTLVLVLAATGGRLYGLLQGSAAANNARRAALSYVAARLRAADAADAVHLESTAQGDTLVLADSDGYMTRIYWENGALLEEYTDEPANHPEAAQAVAYTDSFTVRQNGALFIVRTAEGEVRVALHAGEGSAP